MTPGTASTSRCLFCRVLPTTKSIPSSSSSSSRSRKFATTPASHAANRKPAYPNVRAVDMGLVEQKVAQAAANFTPYTAREKQLLALKYTPSQLRAIEAAEKAIDPSDIVAQGKWRRDPFALDYIDDMSRIKPLVDKPVRAPDADIDPDIRTRSEDEILDRFAAWTESFARKQEAWQMKQETQSDDDILRELRERSQAAGIFPGDGLSPDERRRRLTEYAESFEGPSAQAEWERFIADADNFFHSPKGTLDFQADSLAPAIPKLNSRANGIRFEGEDDDPHMVRLCQQTGLTRDAIRKIRFKNLVSHRVVNQTRMGKIQSLYYLTIAGNENGMLGVGEGKASEDEDGRRQAMMNAIRNMKPIPRYENRTIYGEVHGKSGASVVQISSRPPGFGNRCQHLIYEMARAAGIQDLSARCPRSRNPMNIVKATWQALMSQRLPDDIARARGRKLVDVRKVYYEGQVY